MRLFALTIIAAMGFAAAPAQAQFVGPCWLGVGCTKPAPPSPSQFTCPPPYVVARTRFTQKLVCRLPAPVVVKPVPRPVPPPAPPLAPPVPQARHVAPIHHAPAHKPVPPPVVKPAPTPAPLPPPAPPVSPPAPQSQH